MSTKVIENGNESNERYSLHNSLVTDDRTVTE